MKWSLNMNIPVIPSAASGSLVGWNFSFFQTVWWPDFTLNVTQQKNGSELTVLKKVHVHQSHSGKQIVAGLLIMSVLCPLLTSFPPFSLVVTCHVCLLSAQGYWNEDRKTNTELTYYLSNSPEPHTLYSSWLLSQIITYLLIRTEPFFILIWLKKKITIIFVPETV